METIDTDNGLAVMNREVTAHLEIAVESSVDLALAIAVASPYTRDESLTISLNGAELTPLLLDAPHGGRIHLLRDVRPGRVIVDYWALVSGEIETPPPDDLEHFLYLRPSRYCESDQLGPLARAEFAGLNGHDLLDAVASWVGVNIAYIPGASRPIDGAIATLLGRAGVCRDFAHLTAALLRANGVPARVVAVYAPGLDPMDFHAVAEAAIDGTWHAVDPTCLAPRASMVRIATGADASDTAFLTNARGSVTLEGMWVSATCSPTLPYDDVRQHLSLG